MEYSKYCEKNNIRVLPSLWCPTFNPEDIEYPKPTELPQIQTLKLNDQSLSKEKIILEV